MSELGFLWQAVKNLSSKHGRKLDHSILVNRDGSVRINLDSEEGRARVIKAANSVKDIKIARPAESQHRNASVK